MLLPSNVCGGTTVVDGTEGPVVMRTKEKSKGKSPKKGAAPSPPQSPTGNVHTNVLTAALAGMPTCMLVLIDCSVSVVALANVVTHVALTVVLVAQLNYYFTYI